MISQIRLKLAEIVTKSDDCSSWTPCWHLCHKSPSSSGGYVTPRMGLSRVPALAAPRPFGPVNSHPFIDRPRLPRLRFFTQQQLSQRQPKISPAQLSISSAPALSNSAQHSSSISSESAQPSISSKSAQLSSNTRLTISARSESAQY